MVQIPIVGRVAAGEPILAEENIEDYYPVPTEYISSNKELFMLKVQGESMVNAGILDGDYVVVEKQPTAENGDMIVALILKMAQQSRPFTEKKVSSVSTRE